MFINLGFFKKIYTFLYAHIGSSNLFLVCKLKCVRNIPFQNSTIKSAVWDTAASSLWDITTCIFASLPTVWSPSFCIARSKLVSLLLLIALQLCHIMLHGATAPLSSFASASQATKCITSSHIITVWEFFDNLAPEHMQHSWVAPSTTTVTTHWLYYLKPCWALYCHFIVHKS